MSNRQRVKENIAETSIIADAGWRMTDTGTKSSYITFSYITTFSAKASEEHHPGDIAHLEMQKRKLHSGKVKRVNRMGRYFYISRDFFVYFSYRKSSFR